MLNEENKIFKDCCNTCRTLLLQNKNKDDKWSSSISVIEDDAIESSAKSASSETNCRVCRGLCLSSRISKELENSIRSSLIPYGLCMHEQSQDRVVMMEAPSITLPGEIALRAYLMLLDISTIKRNENITSNSEETDDSSYESKVEWFLYQLKALVKSRVRKYLTQSYNIIFRDEEGAMNIHIVLRCYLKNTFPSSLLKNRDDALKKNRKRFRGHTNLVGHGGDPRANLESRIRSNKSVDGYVELPSYKIVLQSLVALFDKSSSIQQKQPLLQWWSSSSHIELSEICVSSTAWRTAFYIAGRYTKSRRDVSQTPFYVKQEGMTKKLGFSSVEEQVCPVISNKCGGISSLNNSSEEKSRELFGFCKFHASGREDIDVLMNASKGRFTGRPFVCGVIDALRRPTLNDLLDATTQLNCIDKNEEVWTNGFYGRNVCGVGIDLLEFTDSSRFSGLQEETENKVKHYKCLCWSEIELDQSIMRSLTRNEATTIRQTTPIRVLHRRSLEIRTREVLKMKAEEITINDDDKRWFVLYCSTSAGTYVKEFVHGDMGRTNPSISGIIGGKVDIVQLDCIGIEA